MRPTKTKDLYPEIAFASGSTPEEVKVVAEHFWSKVRESLSSLSDIRIHLENLGDFTIKHWLIEKEIEKLEGIMKHREKWADSLQIKIDRLIRARDLHLEEVQKKEFIYNHKKQTHENKPRKSAEDLEEQESDH